MCSEFTFAISPLSIGVVNTAGKNTDIELRSRALANATELTDSLRGHEKELSDHSASDGAELAQRAADAVERVARLLAETIPTPTEQDFHE